MLETGQENVREPGFGVVIIGPDVKTWAGRKKERYPTWMDYGKIIQVRFARQI